MTHNSYQSWLITQARKIARSKKDRRPGMPVANVPSDGWERHVQPLLDSGALQIVKAAPYGRRTLSYLVAP